jgi:hypothetical protein
MALVSQSVQIPAENQRRLQDSADVVMAALDLTIFGATLELTCSAIYPNQVISAKQFQKLESAPQLPGVSDSCDRQESTRPLRAPAPEKQFVSHS